MRHGSMVFLTRSSTSASSLARVSLMLRCFGPEASAVTYGRFTSVCCARRQLDLRALGGVLQALQRQRILAQVDALLLLEFLDEVVDDALVEVFAAEERVAVGRQHLELLLAVDFGDLDDRDVERAAAQVVHRDLAVAALLVHAIGQRGRGRLVDDALDVEARDAAGVLGRLALRVVEVRRHRDHGFGDRLAEIVLGGLLHLHEHARRDFLRRHLLAVAVSTQASPLSASTILYGTMPMSFCTSASANLRPIRRLTA